MSGNLNLWKVRQGDWSYRAEWEGGSGGEQSAGWGWGPTTRSLLHLHRLLWATGRTFIPRELRPSGSCEQSRGKILLFFFPAVLHLRCHMWALSCNMQSLVSWLGIKPRAPCIGSGILPTGPPEKSRVYALKGSLWLPSCREGPRVTARRPSGSHCITGAWHQGWRWRWGEPVWLWIWF